MTTKDTDTLKIEAYGLKIDRAIKAIRLFSIGQIIDMMDRAGTK